ncbi:hypothetical protein Nepgr_006105 [Nepenthes gracilis]|uniref:Uncharacterized protein n=1 Tax=Nepenthes gracilis TaxID=150966 RepID=A0AAD3S4S6_NEPGR|nr:hypothetical protein Nepgr_006105 [Nepenthes gracilis]
MPRGKEQRKWDVKAWVTGLLSERLQISLVYEGSSEIAPRSVRGRGLHKQKLEDGQVCALELLATVAGKFLLESESSSASSRAAAGVDRCSIGKNVIKQEPHDVYKPLGAKHDDQGSSEESVFFPGLHLQSYNQDANMVVLDTVTEAVLGHASAIASSYSGKFDSDVESAINKSKDEFIKCPSKIEGGFPKHRKLCEADIEDRINRQHNITRGVAGAKDPAGMCRKLPALVDSNNNVEFPLCINSIHSAFSRHRSDVKVGRRDDDEILSQLFQPSSKVKEMLSPKLLTSKYSKAASKLKDSEVASTAVESRIDHIYHSKKLCYEHERSQCNTLFKKRKLFDQSSVVPSDGGVSCESASHSLEMGIDNKKRGLSAKLQAENGMSSIITGHQMSHSSKNSNVKLTIQSVKVPELFIEVPESTTVGSLKRTVLDAMTALLRGGLGVGVLLHGKKIQDDDITLLQSGISHNGNLDTLGFIIEPSSPAQPSPPLCCEDPPVLLAFSSPKNCVNRSQFTTNEDLSPSNAGDKSLVVGSGSYNQSSQDLIPFSTAELFSKTTMSDSRALVPVPEISMEALAMIPPANRRHKRPEIGQRRTRRPFSVSEVEALVQAVEKLGTGRWRDVKLCATENVKHRTYVDLKDKWKTLVHTARISPQQRRGEPVPQELLDRVLAAHAYWTQHHVKQQHGKQQHAGILKTTQIPSEKAVA